MVIYLRHPRHGTKVAISEDEVMHDEKRGWEVYDPTPVVEETPKQTTKSAAKKAKPANEDTQEAVSELPEFLNN